MYYVTVLNSFLCDNNDSVNVTITPQPTAKVTGDTVVCFGVSAQLAASGGTNYAWNTGQTNSSISVTPSITTNYIVTVSNGLCSDSDSITVNVTAEESHLFTPNIFTPNNDGLNELFNIVSMNITNFTGMIFNRWGELIYEWDESKKRMGWNI